MPTYQVYVNQNRLNAAQKKDVALAITEGHCACTGAPGYYVQVIIHEVPDQNRFICGRPFAECMWIRGDVRCRSAEQNKRLMTELADRVSAVCDFRRDFIWCDLCGIEPTDIFKFGTVFPPAGQEQAWYDALPPQTRAVIAELSKAP